MQLPWPSGRGVDHHGVAELLELRDEPTRVGFLVPLGQPLRAEVAVRLVTLERM